MNKPEVSKWTRKISLKAAEHSPEILTGIGIAGMVTSTVLAVKATPKALQFIDDAREEKQDELTVPEVVKVAWKPYIPSAITCALSVTCLIGASSVNARRNAALATAYKLSETALTEYREKVTETIGEKKEKEIRKEVAKDKLERDPIQKTNVIVTGKGDTFCRDPFGREFTTSIDAIQKAEVKLNKKITRDQYASLNDFYDELGLDSTDVGESVGWTQDSGYIEVDFHPIMLNEDVCLMLDFTKRPEYDYYKFVR